MSCELRAKYIAIGMPRLAFAAGMQRGRLLFGLIYVVLLVCVPLLSTETNTAGGNPCHK
jgi:hypothetical protein